MRRISRLFVLTALLSVAEFAGAQANQGTPSFSAFDSHTIDTVNLQNLTVTLNVPGMLKGGAFPFSFGMQANYYVYAQSGNLYPGIVALPFTPTVNGVLGLFSSYAAPSNTQYSVACPHGGYTTKYSGWYIQFADGTTHWLPASDYTDEAGCLNASFTDQVIDRAGYTLSVTKANVNSIYDRSGLVLSTSTNPNILTDSNANTIKWNYDSGVFTDTLGLTALTGYYGSSGSYNWTDVNGGSPTINIATNPTATLRSNFGCSNAMDYDTAADIVLPTQISFPDSSSIGILYEQTNGYSGDYTGRVSQFTLRTGGTIGYNYNPSSGTHDGLNCTYQVPNKMTRTTSDGTTTYAWAAVNNGSGNYGNTTVVTDNGGNQTVYSFTGLTSSGIAAPPVTQALTQIQHYQGGCPTTVTGCNGGGSLLTTDLYCYNAATGQPGNCGTAVVSLPIKEVDIYHTISGMSSSSRIQTKYDKYGNITYSAQYDFGASSPTVATTTTYGSCSAGCTGSSPTISAVGSNVNNKPGDILTTQNGSSAAESRFTYDSHGNLLTTYKWTGTPWLSNSTPNSYNSNGTIATSYDFNNNPTSYSYSAASYSSCGSCTNYAFPTSVSKGGLTTYSTWHGIGGVKLTDKDANGNTTTYKYVTSGGTADPFWRVMSVTDPLSNVVYKTYPSTTTANSSFTFNSGQSIQNTTATTDGYGRQVNVQTQQGPSSGTYDTVSTGYGWSGNSRTVATSQPCTQNAGGTCTTVHTSSFDPLGRLSQKTTTNNETVTKTYTQNDVLSVLSPHPSGENVKQTQKQYDGLGRLQYSCAIGNGSTTACGQNTGTANGVTTAYAYTSANGSTTVTVTRSVQVRTKINDAIGRLVYDNNPESGAVSYVYDIDSQCTLAGSKTTSIGDLISSTDANGYKTCRSYDTLHRLTDVVVIKNGVCVAPTKRFRYDSSSNNILTVPTGYSGQNLVGKMFEAWTGDCTWPIATNGSTSTTDEWFSYSEVGQMTDLWESTWHIPGYYHSTAGYAANGVLTSIGGVPGYSSITYGLDGEGRLNTATQGSTSLVTGVNYTAAGQTANIYIGAGDSDNYSYDSNTGRMTNWTFTVGSTPKSQTGTLNWNPNGTLGSLVVGDGFNTGGAQTCTFSYDDLARLVTDNCGSTIWNQTFSYDQYDNITKTGNPGTSWACAGCYDTSTSHYNSTLSPLISYDANGNLTDDSFHDYGWFADNKPQSVDSTDCTIFTSTTGTCVIYDALGRLAEVGVNGAYTEIMYTPAGKTAIMNGMTTVQQAFFPLPGGATVNESGGSGVIRYFWHKDWLGSVRLASSIQGRTYYFDRAFTPYGESYQNFGNTASLDFTGDTQDIFAGLFDTPNRELSSSQGRWMSPDPARAGWNLYAYGTNPNGAIDPSGLCLLVSSDGGCTGGIAGGLHPRPQVPGGWVGGGSSGIYLVSNSDTTVWVTVGADSGSSSDTSSAPQICGCLNDLTSGALAGTAAPPDLGPYNFTLPSQLFEYTLSYNAPVPMTPAEAFVVTVGAAPYAIMLGGTAGAICAASSSCVALGLIGLELYNTIFPDVEEQPANVPENTGHPPGEGPEGPSAPPSAPAPGSAPPPPPPEPPPAP